MLETFVKFIEWFGDRWLLWLFACALFHALLYWQGLCVWWEK